MFPAALLLKSDGRRWRTLHANLFRQGKRPCLMVDDVRARRWRWWYDQVIPLSELSVARGYLQSAFLFWTPASLRLASPRHASPLLSSPRVSSRPRDLTEISIWERALSLAADSLMRDFIFLARNASRMHFCAFRRAAPFLPSVKTLEWFRMSLETCYSRGSWLNFFLFIMVFHRNAA